jgi:predicted RNase H-like HicB family nuclease
MAIKYTAIYDLGDDSWWTVRIKEVGGVHSQGRSIAQARNRVREALSLFVDDAEDAEMISVIHVDPEIRRVLDLTASAKREVVKVQERMSKARDAGREKAGRSDERSSCRRGTGPVAPAGPAARAVESETQCRRPRTTRLVARSHRKLLSAPLTAVVISPLIEDRSSHHFSHHSA